MVGDGEGECWGTRAHRRALARARDRNFSSSSSETRLEDESREFHKVVRDAYLAMAAAEPERFIVIDGAASIEEVAARVWKEVGGRV